MIIRAAFAIGLVALLIPKEPDVGLGHPQSILSAPSAILAAACAQLAQSTGPCSTMSQQDVSHAADNAGDTSVFEKLHRVKAEIEEDMHRRAASRIMVGEEQGAGRNKTGRPAVATSQTDFESDAR